MAEASMEDRPPINRFFCHKCNIHFQNATSNFTCPHCSHGFIEELDVQVLDDVGRIGVDLSDELTSSDDEVLQMMHLSDFEHLISSRLPRAARPHWPRPVRRNANGSSGSAHHSNRRRRWPVNARQANAAPAQQQQQQQQQSYEHMIQEFILNLTGTGWTADFNSAPAPAPAAAPHHMHNMHLLLPGNPGDYAWGREGLDAIVTQLLNQMDSTGPPPLHTDAIEALPLVAVGGEHVAAKLQCSVCWEDFRLGEQVKALPCQHLYHDGCIVPWLALHGTCPICRQVLQVAPGGEAFPASEAHETHPGNGHSTYNVLQHLLNAVHGAAATSNSDASATATLHSNNSREQSDDGND